MSRYLRTIVPLRLATNLLVQDFILDNNEGWHDLKVHQFFTPASARRIVALEPPTRSSQPDTLYWPLTKSGVYSTKIGYAFIIQQQQNETYSMTTPVQRRFFSTIWSLNIMPK